MTDEIKKPTRKRRPKKKVEEDDGMEPIKTRNKSAGGTKYVSDQKKKAKVTVSKFDVPTSMLKLVTDIAAPVDEDVTVKFRDDGIYASNVDVTNALAMWMDLDSVGYTYDGEEVSVCVNVLKLAQAIKGTDKDDVSIVSVRNGSMFVSTHGVVVRLPVFVDGREAPPNKDDIVNTIPNSLKVSTSYIKRFMGVAKDEKGAFMLSMYDETFHLSMLDEMTDQENVKLDVPDDKVRDVDIKVDSETQLGVDIAFSVFGIMANVSKSVVIHSGADMPVYVYAKLESGYEINYIMAPRIVRDD